MKEDSYYKWIEWSDEDQVYLGRCPDIIIGIHGDDPILTDFVENGHFITCTSE